MPWYSSQLSCVLFAVIALVLSACSATPEPICSRIESLENQKRCPAPPPPVTRKSELSDEAHQALLENTHYSTTTDLGPEAKVKRKAILARIEALKASIPPKYEAPLPTPVSHITQSALAATEPEQETSAATEIKPAESVHQFSVQLGAFKQSKGRDILSQRISGGPVYSYMLVNGLHALSIGNYATLNDAELAAIEARNNGFTGAYATQLPADARVLENHH